MFSVFEGYFSLFCLCKSHSNSSRNPTSTEQCGSDALTTFNTITTRKMFCFLNHTFPIFLQIS